MGREPPRIALTGVLKSWESADRRFELTVPDMVLEAGRIVILTGPNGTGKTTLMELLGLASRPDSGRIEIDLPGETHDVSALWRRGDGASLARLRARAYGYVLQTIQLLPFLSIRENAVLAQRISGRVDLEYVDWLFEALGVAAHGSALPERLSPGLRQRAAVARALASHPRFVLADEPTSALDPEGGRAVMQLMMSLAREDGAAVLLCTHQADGLDIAGASHIQTRSLPSDRPGLFRATVERAGP